MPTVLDQGGDGAGSWLLTAGLPGRNAVEARWLADPGRAVRAVGVGLRALHDALPVAGCPFSWSVSDRRAAAAAVATTPAQRRLVDDLGDPPPPDLLVVCHGDACVPNTLLTDDGTCSGHVDLGALGVADRWADLAVATWSTVWNYGPGWETVLLDAYGVAPDDDRTAYYRRLWRLGPLTRRAGRRLPPTWPPCARRSRIAAPPRPAGTMWPSSTPTSPCTWPSSRRRTIRRTGLRSGMPRRAGLSRIAGGPGGARARRWWGMPAPGW